MSSHADDIKQDLKKIKAALEANNNKASGGPWLAIWFFSIVALVLASFYFTRKFDARLNKQESDSKSLGQAQDSEKESSPTNKSENEALGPLLARIEELEKSQVNRSDSGRSVELAEELAQLHKEIEGLKAQLKSNGESADLEESTPEIEGKGVAKSIRNLMSQSELAEVLGEPSHVRTRNVGKRVECIWRYDSKPRQLFRFVTRLPAGDLVLVLDAKQDIDIEAARSAPKPDPAYPWRELNLGMGITELDTLIGGRKIDLLTGSDRSVRAFQSAKGTGIVYLARPTSGAKDVVVGWSEPEFDPEFEWGLSLPAEDKEKTVGEKFDFPKSGGLELWDLVRIGDSRERVIAALGQPWRIIARPLVEEESWNYGYWRPDRGTIAARKKFKGAFVSFDKGKVDRVVKPRAAVWRRYPPEVIPHSKTWRQLKVHMTQEEVRRLLGEPERVETLSYNSSVTWYYSDSDDIEHVKFYSYGKGYESITQHTKGKSCLTSWAEPSLSSTDMKELENKAKVAGSAD